MAFPFRGVSLTPRTHKYFLQRERGKGGKKKHTAEKCAAMGGKKSFVEVRGNGYRRGNEI